MAAAGLAAAGSGAKGRNVRTRLVPQDRNSTDAARQVRLPPEVNRILYVRNLPFNISADEMYDIFGKYGAVRQIRLGNGKDTRGTAYVVYEDIYDAKAAADHLSGFNVNNRYLICLYYSPKVMSGKADQAQKEEELRMLKERLAAQQAANAAGPA